MAAWLTLLMSVAAAAEPVASARVWPQLRLEVPLGARTTLQAETSSRVTLVGGATGWDRAVSALTANVRLVGALQAGLGGAWVARHTNRSLLDVTELRVFEQLLWSQHEGGLTFASRTRLEHRFVGDATLHRLRVQGRLGGSVSERVELYGLVESFVQLHDGVTAHAGLEQQRLQLGVVWRLTPQVSLDVAFLERWLTGLNAPNEWQQVLAVTLVLQPRAR